MNTIAKGADLAAAGGAARASPDRSGIALATTALIAIHVALLLYTGWANAPNELEANLLPAGYLHLKYGRFDCAQVNPPLSRMLMAVPLLAFDVKEDWSGLIDGPGVRPEYAVGKDFLKNNVSQIRAMYAASRTVAALFSVLGAVAVYHIARPSYGERAAFVAVTVWCFCPTILGHAATAGHDVPGAAVAALAYLSFRRLFNEQGWTDALICGISSGAAVLTRTTDAALIAFWLLVFIVVNRAARRTWLSLFARISKAMSAVALAVFVLNVGYEFSESLMPLGDFQFVSRALSGREDGSVTGNRFRGTCLQDVPVPLPKEFMRGVDLQQKDFESPPFKSYLFGEWQSFGWWYYYLAAWSVKTPIGFQALFAVAVASLAMGALQKSVRAEEVVLAFSVLLVFAVASAKSGFTTHYRYVLSALPFVAVVSSRIWRREFHGARIQAISAAFLVAGIASSLFSYPHSLSYFNEWVGGPRNGANYLLQSSSDWGQDLFRASDWLVNCGGQLGEGHLCLHGPLRPESLGVPRQSVPRRRSPSKCRGSDEEEIRPGMYALSATAIHDENDAYRYLTEVGVSRRIGYSVNVYKVSQTDIDRMGLNIRCKAAAAP